MFSPLNLANSVISSKFVNNSAVNGGAINYKGQDTDNDDVVHLDDVLFDGNKADNGGALYLEFAKERICSRRKCQKRSIIFNWSRLRFVNNIATENGGAFFMIYPTFTLESRLTIAKSFFLSTTLPSEEVIVPSPF